MMSSDRRIRASGDVVNRADIIISNVAALLPESVIERDAAVVVTDGVIVAVGAQASIAADWGAETASDGRGGVLSPGLLDAHTHLGLSFARALPEMKGHPVYDVFWPLETSLDPEMVAAFASASVAEGLLAGVTTVADHYFFADATVAAATELGIRAVIGQTILRHDGPHHSEDSLSAGIDFAQRHIGTPLIHSALTPHALDTVGDDWIVEIAAAARELDIPVHLHVAQSEREYDTILDASGRSPIAQLAELGVLDQRTVAAHCMYATPDDLDLLAKHHLVHPIYCPTVHAGLGKIMAAAELHRAGSIIGIGTDAAPNERFDVLAEARAASRHQAVLGESLTVDDTFTIATEHNAIALGLGEITGRIEVGYAADLVLWRTDAAVAAAIGDERRYVAAVAGPDVVDSVWVAGKRVVEGGELTSGDEQSITRKANQAREALFAKADL